MSTTAATLPAQRTLPGTCTTGGTVVVSSEELGRAMPSPMVAATMPIERPNRLAVLIRRRSGGGEHLSDWKKVNAG